MLVYNELRITPDSKHLIVDVSVDSAKYFDDVIIDSIVIDTHNTYVPNGPSSTPVYTYTVKEQYDFTYTYPDRSNCNPVLADEESYCFVYGNGNMKNVRLVISAKELGGIIDKTMFFVYTIASGTVTADTPNELNKAQILGTVVDLKGYYNQFMKYAKEIECSCDIPKNFIDYLLRLKALELSIKTGNYTQAISLWKKFFTEYKSRKVSNLP